VTELYLVRHGQSQNNAFAAESKASATEETPRTSDPSLTPAGYAQAKCVARYLAGEADKTDVRDGTPVENGHGIQKLYTRRDRFAVAPRIRYANSPGIERR